MSTLHLRDERANLLEHNRQMLSAAQGEVRKLSDEETRIFNENLVSIRRLDAEIKAAQQASARSNGEQVNRNDKTIKNVDMSNFSLIAAINNKLEGRNHSEAALSIFTQGKEEMRRSGLTNTGDIVLPIEYRAEILAGTATQGAEIVPEQKMAILPPLENKLVLAQAGATFLTGLIGNVSVPSYSGTTALWKGETTAASDGAGTFSDVQLTPKRLTAYLDVSKLFLAQDSVGAERMLLDNIQSAVARKLEATILGVAAGSTTQPQGMGYKITTGGDTAVSAVIPDWGDIVALETAVDTANAANGKLGYITNAAGRGILKSIQKNYVLDPSLGYIVAGSNSLLEGGLMNGYPVYVTNGCSNIAGAAGDGNLLLFGNWADLCIAQWGGYDITVDPYTVAKEGKVRIVINAYFDAKGLRGAAATEASGATQDDDYAVSFASAAIKLS